MSLISPKLTQTKQLWQVAFIGNFYSGKYYSSGVDCMLVLASCPDEAKYIAKHNISTALEHFKNKRYRVGSRGVRAIRKKDNILKVAYSTAKLTQQQQYNKALLPDGTIGSVDLG
tara:strand:- start:310 stop:654 length:345 start_codon:yes stop_codon:yes gene_type:complete